MSSKSFIIKGAFHKPKGSRKATKCLPDLNDLIDYAKSNPYKYQSYKLQFEKIVMRKAQLQLGNWKPKGRVRLELEFGEPIGHYRDYDNISAGAIKIIADALQMCKILENDNPKYLAPSKCIYVYTKDEPYVKVTIHEIGEIKQFKEMECEE